MVATGAPSPSIFVADESRLVCRMLARWFADAGFTVAGMAHDGEQALTQIVKLRPTVATVAIKLPKRDGLSVISAVMQQTPTPMVVISGVTREAATLTLRAIDLGAIDFAAKFAFHDQRDHETLRAEIVSKVRVAAKVKVIRPAPVSVPLRRETPMFPVAKYSHSVVVIGASTGGPVAVRELLGQLPANFPAAVVVVQHMPEMFTSIFAAQMDKTIALPVREAADGDKLQPGRVLIAPGDWHLLLEGLTVRLMKGPKIRGFRPSVDVTMQSVAQSFGAQTCGVILTGMGEDGTAGLATIRARGGRTLAQDATSSVVNGMPQAAIDRGVVEVVDTPSGIAHRLRTMFATP